jgi:DNA-binding XRE family transcriptional regulator
MAQNPKSMDTASTSVEVSPKEAGSAGTGKVAKRAAGRAARAVSSQSGGAGRKKRSQRAPSNRVRQTRIERMMSKAELARRAGLSVLTIDRIEKGLGCRMDTKRKILEALGLSLADRVRVFGEEE